jgi:hypothetical protein
MNAALPYAIALLLPSQHYVARNKHFLKKLAEAKKDKCGAVVAELNLSVEIPESSIFSSPNPCLRRSLDEEPVREAKTHKAALSNLRWVAYRRFKTCAKVPAALGYKHGMSSATLARTISCIAFFQTAGSTISLNNKISRVGT